MRWEDEHDDPNAEPYTVLHIRRAGEVRWRVATSKDIKKDPMWLDEVMIRVPPGRFHFHVFFRTYHKRSWFSVEGRDELEAFMIATKRLAKNKAKSDQRRLTRISLNHTKEGAIK